MKTLLLARHAKSDWNSPTANDFDRPLNQRGQQDAPLMASYLKQCGYSVGQIISSDALRALQTAEHYRQCLKPSHDLISYHDLYLASLQAIVTLVQHIAPGENTVMLVGHNPGMSEALNYFSTETVSDMPTCSVGIIQFDVAQWQDAAQSSGVLLGFEYPKRVKSRVM